MCTVQSDKRQYFSNCPAGHINTQIQTQKYTHTHTKSQRGSISLKKLPYVLQTCLTPRTHTMPQKSVVSQLYRETYQLTSSLSLFWPSWPTSRRCTDFSLVTCKEVEASTVLFTGIFYRLRFKDKPLTSSLLCLSFPSSTPSSSPLHGHDRSHFREQRHLAAVPRARVWPVFCT